MLGFRLDGFDLGGGKPSGHFHKHISHAALCVYCFVHFVVFCVAGVGIKHFSGVFPNGEFDVGVFAFLDLVAELLPAVESVDCFGEFNGDRAVVGFDFSVLAGAFQKSLVHQADALIQNDGGVIHGVISFQLFIGIQNGNGNRVIKELIKLFRGEFQQAVNQFVKGIHICFSFVFCVLFVSFSLITLYYMVNHISIRRMHKD